MLTIALTASRSNRRCADIFGIRDPWIALMFDLRCNEILTEWEFKREDEKEKRQIEAMAVGGLTSALGTPKVTVDRTKAERW